MFIFLKILYLKKNRYNLLPNLSFKTHTVYSMQTHYFPRTGKCVTSVVRGATLLSACRPATMCYIHIFLVQGISFAVYREQRHRKCLSLLSHSPLGTIKEQGTIVNPVNITRIFIDNMLRIIVFLELIYDGTRKS